MVASPDLSVFGKLRSFDDYQRMQEEFQLKKAQQEQAAQLGQLQIQQAQKQMATPDLESLAQQSLYAYHQGQPLTPEGKAALETLATMKGSSVQYQPDAYGNVKAVSEPNPYQQFLGRVGGGQMFNPQQGAAPYQGKLDVAPMDLASIEAMTQDAGSANIEFNPNSPAMNMGGKQQSDLSRMAFDPKNAPSLDAEVLSSPYGKKAVFDQQLKLMGDINNPSTEIGKMQKDEKLGLVPAGSTQALIKEKSRQTRKEDMALDKEEKAAKEADDQAKATKKVAEKKIKEALGILKKSFTASGFPATAALNMVPGKSLPPDVLNSAYSTLKSNISLDAMMKLKQASATGSTGFGALSQNELKILTDKIGELDAELPYKTQMENLKTIADILKLDIPELTGNKSDGDIQNLIDEYAD